VLSHLQRIIITNLGGDTNIQYTQAIFDVLQQQPGAFAKV
jgi:hypothetical protein